jgi:two-component system, OmpR family, phosphate regulon response regulator OmpR
VENTELKPHILVVDDDDRLRALLTKYLSDQGFMVSAAADAMAARKMLDVFLFDIMVLDVMMPGETGLELLASVPGLPPVLMLSAMSEPQDRIQGLEVGAEDYLTKPFEPKELVLRLRAILRRTARAEQGAQAVAFGEYVFDMGGGLLKRGAEVLHLTSGEQAMLRLLAQQAGNPVTREELSKVMPAAGNERSIDVQITRLRKKIEESEGKPLYLQTVRGAGYVLHARRLT